MTLEVGDIVEFSQEAKARDRYYRAPARQKLYKISKIMPGPSGLRAWYDSLDGMISGVGPLEVFALVQRPK